MNTLGYICHYRLNMSLIWMLIYRLSEFIDFLSADFADSTLSRTHSSFSVFIKLTSIVCSKTNQNFFIFICSTLLLLSFRKPFALAFITSSL